MYQLLYTDVEDTARKTALEQAYHTHALLKSLHNCSKCYMISNVALNKKLTFGKPVLVDHRSLKKIKGIISVMLRLLLRVFQNECEA